MYIINHRIRVVAQFSVTRYLLTYNKEKGEKEKYSEQFQRIRNLTIKYGNQYEFLKIV